MERSKYQQTFTPKFGLFVGNLNRNTNHERLHKYFEFFGPVISAVVKTHKGKSRGFGVVYFSSLVSVNKVLTAPRGHHWLDGRQIEPRILLPREQYVASKIQRQVMVHPVDPAKGIRSIYELKAYFSKFGHVTKSHTPLNKETKKFMGYGEVVFEDSRTAARMLKIGLHEISPGKWVRCYPPKLRANGIMFENPDPKEVQDQVKSAGYSTTHPKSFSTRLTSNLKPVPNSTPTKTLNSSPIPTVVAGTCAQGPPGGHIDPDRDEKPEPDPLLKLQSKSTSVSVPAVAVRSKSNSKYYGRRYRPPYVVPRKETAAAANGYSNNVAMVEQQRQHWEQISMMANYFHQMTIPHYIDFSKDYDCSNNNYGY